MSHREEMSRWRTNVTLGLPRCAGDDFESPTHAEDLDRVVGFVIGHGVIGRSWNGTMACLAAIMEIGDVTAGVR